MDRKKFLAERQWIRSQLANVADFWLRNGWDHDNGGVTTCLDRAGQVYSTDKSVWMQGRCGWTYAYLCNIYARSLKKKSRNKRLSRLVAS